MDGTASRKDFFFQDQSFNPSSIGLVTGNGVANQGLPIIVISGTPCQVNITCPKLASQLPSSVAFAQLGATSGDPRSRVDSNNQVIDNVSWKINKHDVKFGAEFRRTTVEHVFDKYFRGKLSFKDSLTVDPVTNVVSGATALDNFLSGTVNTGFGSSFQYSGDSLRHTFENSYGLYIQDSYRVSTRLTVNLGLRWDYFGVVGEKNNLLSNATGFDLAAGTVTLAQVGSPQLSRLYEPDYKNFAPRVSFAWDMTGKGKTVLRAGYGIFYDAFSQDFFLGHLPYPPFYDPGPAYNPVGPAQIVPAAPCTASTPCPPGVTPGLIVSGQPIFNTSGCSTVECDMFLFDRNIRTPYMENYNLNIQHQIANNVVLEVGYVGSQGHRLFRFRDINQPSAAQIFASDCPNGGVPGQPCPGGSITTSYSVPRPFGNNQYGAFYIMQEEAKAKSNYNSLQTSLRMTGWHGVTSIVNYVWSRSFDTASDGEDFEPNAAQPYDSTRPNLEYGPSNFDIPQRFTWFFAYQLPKMSGGAQKLRNGWGLASTLTLQSGQPFQFNYNFEDDFSGAGEGIDRPDVVGPIVYHPGSPNYVDLNSFAIPCTISPTVTTPTGTNADCIPGTRHIGNLGRDALRGPDFRQWDLAIFKDTPISERLTMQLRADFFNVLNHPNFAIFAGVHC